MITSQKIKLLINDPKFRSISNNNKNSQQQALEKIYANQKQVHRSKIVDECCLIKKDELKNVNTTMDFLQTKIFSLQTKIVGDIQETFNEKQKIEYKYKAMQDIYQKAQKNYKSLLKQISQDIDQQKKLQIYQKQIQQINQLFEQNIFLKNLNHQIIKRIKQKQQKAQILKTA